MVLEFCCTSARRIPLPIAYLKKSVEQNPRPSFFSLIDKSLEKGIAITGPIGSGKSTILNYFKENGFITYSCDEMVHKLYEKPEISRKISQILNAPFDINNKKTTKLARKIMIDNPEIKKKIE